MWFILFLTILIMIYVGTFREDFSDEHIGVLTVVLVGASILILVTTIV